MIYPNALLIGEIIFGRGILILGCCVLYLELLYYYFLIEEIRRRRNEKI
jgi:hypothetical protein